MKTILERKYRDRSAPFSEFGTARAAAQPG